MDTLPFPDPPLDDGIVALRAKVAGDVPGIVAALQDREISRWTTIPWPYTEAIARQWLLQSEALRRAGEHLNLLAVESEAPAVILGSIGLMREANRPGIGELGYWVAAPARGRGVCTRAVVLMRDWASTTLGFERLEILPHRDNAPSRRVAERAGFVDTGALRVAPRTEGAAALTHAVYVWEGSSAPT